MHIKAPFIIAVCLSVMMLAFIVFIKWTVGRLDYWPIAHVCMAVAMCSFTFAITLLGSSAAMND